MRRIKDRYLLHEPIGKGALGVVYRADDELLGVPVAVKEVLQSVARRLGMGGVVLQEARAMARLSHPGILRVIDVGEDDGSCFVVMDYAPGGSLAARLEREGVIPPEEAIELMVRALEALDYVHRAGFLHRDIKPANILLGAEGQPLLADFGIAATLDEKARTTGRGRILGTYAYMAPEQRRGNAPLTEAVDLYAVACTLFELISGSSPMDLFVTTPDSPRWEAVPAFLRPTLQRGTQLRPAARFPSAEAMVEALRGHLEFLRSGEAPPTWTPPETGGFSEAAEWYRSTLPARAEELMLALRGHEGGDEGATRRIREIAHALRGSGASFGFPAISTAAAMVEDAAGGQLARAVHGLSQILSQAARTITTPALGVVALLSTSEARKEQVEHALERSPLRLAVVSDAQALQELSCHTSVEMLLLDLDDGGTPLLIQLARGDGPSGEQPPMLALSSSRAMEEVALAAGVRRYVCPAQSAVEIAEAVEGALVRHPEDLQFDPGTGLLDHQSFLHKLVEAQAHSATPIFALTRLAPAEGLDADDERWDRVLGAAAMALAQALPKDAVVARWGSRTLGVLFLGGRPSVAVSALEQALRAVVARAPSELQGACAGAMVLGAETLQRSLQLVSDAARGSGTRVQLVDSDPIPEDESVLVVDDDPAISRLIDEALRDERLRVRAITDGAQALASAERHCPTLIILDVEMPGQDGYRTLVELRASRACSDTPILLLTARTDERDVMLALELGADDFLSKPFRPGELRARVRRLMRSARRRSSARHQELPTA